MCILLALLALKSAAALETVSSSLLSSLDPLRLRGRASGGMLRVDLEGGREKKIKDCFFIYL